MENYIVSIAAFGLIPLVMALIILLCKYCKQKITGGNTKVENLKNHFDDVNLKTCELPIEEIIEFKGIKYKIRHKYQNSGENLIDVFKNQLFKTIDKLDGNAVSCYNKDVNIFG